MNPHKPNQHPPAPPPGRKRFGPPWPEAVGRWSEPRIGLFACLRSLGRILAAVGSLGCIAAATALASPFVDTGGVGDFALRFRRKSTALFLRSMGFRLRVQGPSPGHSCLIVANHVSWLDAVVMAACTGASFVAYARDWPLVDWLMVKFGTIMIARGPSSSLPAAVDVARVRLAGGGTVAVFPEGNTSFGPGVLPFKPAFFQAALAAPAPVYTGAIRYATRAPWPSPERVIHWVDWTPLLVHAYRMCALATLEVEMVWAGYVYSEPGMHTGTGWLDKSGEPQGTEVQKESDRIHIAGLDRRNYAAEAERLVLAALSKTNGL